MKFTKLKCFPVLFIAGITLLGTVPALATNFPGTTVIRLGFEDFNGSSPYMYVEVIDKDNNYLACNTLNINANHNAMTSILVAPFALAESTGKKVLVACDALGKLTGVTL